MALVGILKTPSISGASVLGMSVGIPSAQVVRQVTQVVPHGDGNVNPASPFNALVDGNSSFTIREMEARLSPIFYSGEIWDEAPPLQTPLVKVG